MTDTIERLRREAPPRSTRLGETMLDAAAELEQAQRTPELIRWLNDLGS